MNGYLKNFKQQIDALNTVYHNLLRPIEKQISMSKWWLFGGGTALSIFHFQHRVSFDLDIFITESQIFDFLDPKWFIDETDLFDNSNYRFDALKKHLQLRTKKSNIKVDFLLNESIIKQPKQNMILELDYKLYYETIEDIIAKKIKWRKKDNIARDIFDIAMSISHDKDILQKLIHSRFINYNDIEILAQSLKTLNAKEYKIEIEKIKPQTKEYEMIAKNADKIILSSIKDIR